MNQIKNNSRMVRKSNIALITSFLQTCDSATTAEIAKGTDLSIATCGNLVKYLLSTNVIFEGDLLESLGGRPARKYKFNANHSLIIGITITSEGDYHKLKCALLNLNTEILKETETLHKLVPYELLEEIIESFLTDQNQVNAIGIGIPGITEKGIVTHCDIEELIGVPLKQKLEAKFKVNVVVENEMHSLVYGHSLKAEHTKDESLAVILGPENFCLGSGYFVNGQVIKGYKKLSGEIQFLPFGLSMAELRVAHDDVEKFIDLVVFSITSIVAIINPSHLVLTGNRFNSNLVDIISTKCVNQISSEFLPKITFQQDSSAEYFNGVVALTIESLSDGILLVKRRLK